MVLIKKLKNENLKTCAIKNPIQKKELDSKKNMDFSIMQAEQFAICQYQILPKILNLSS